MKEAYDYHTLRAQFETVSCEERLSILRSKLYIPLIAGKSTADKFEDIDLSEIKGLPENFAYFLQALTRSVRQMHTIAFALTDPISKEP